MLDTQEKVLIASKASQKIAQAYGIKDMESRLQQLLSGRPFGDLTACSQAELEYRQAELAVDTARERVREFEGLLKDREDEILAEITEETVQVPVAEKKKPAKKATEGEEAGDDETDAPKFETKPRFTNDSGRKAAVTNRRKTDAEYQGIKASADAAKHEHALAQINLANAKAKYHAMVREQEMAKAQLEATAAQMWMTASRISVLGGFDGEPTPTPAPGQAPAATAQQPTTPPAPPTVAQQPPAAPPPPSEYPRPAPGQIQTSLSAPPLTIHPAPAPELPIRPPLPPAPHLPPQPAASMAGAPGDDCPY